MAMRLVHGSPARRARIPRADLWRTVSGWLWTTYFLAVSGALLWWAL